MASILFDLVLRLLRHGRKILPQFTILLVYILRREWRSLFVTARSIELYFTRDFFEKELLFWMMGSVIDK